MWPLYSKGAILLILLTSRFQHTVSQPCDPIPYLPSPFFFDDTVEGVVNTATTMGYEFEETFKKLIFTDCFTGPGNVKGFEYLQYSDGSFDMNIYDEATFAIVDSYNVADGTADRENYQYICKPTATVLDTTKRYVYAVETSDTTGTLPLWGRVNYVLSNLRIEPDAYPCGEHISTGSADFMLSNTGNFPFGDDRAGRLAVRPILDETFVYTCTCGTDADCNADDCNMLCNGGRCECKPGWKYNARHNQCVFEGMAAAKDVTVVGPESADTSVLVDDDFSTCLAISGDTKPWAVIDLGSDVNVFAVNIKIPLPITLSITTKDAGGNVLETFYPPDPFTVTAIPVQTIESTGPWPMKVYSSTSGSTVIINADLNPTGGTFDVDNDFGIVGGDIGKIELLDQVGYLKTTSGNCITDTAAGAAALPDNSNCGIFYISIHSGGDFLLKLLDETSLHFPGVALGTVAEMGSDVTYKLYTSTIPESGPLGTFFIALSSQKDTSCVTIDAENVVLTGTCDTAEWTFEFYPTMPDDSTETGYSYTRYDMAADSDTQIDIGPFPVKPCIEIVSAGADNQGAYVSSYENPNLKVVPVGIGTDGYTQLTSVTGVTARTTVDGISNFAIGVASTFDGTFTEANFARCTSFPGYPKHGDYNNLYSCDSPTTGRYVGIYSQDVAIDRPFTICDIQVHAKNVGGFDALCETDEDCNCPVRETEDQHFFCNPDSNLCRCMPGYEYWEPALLCINFDECLDNSTNRCDVDESVDGVEDGICRDHLGRYICECPDGYEFDTVNGGCKDIDECALPSTHVNGHHCEHTCVNGYGNYSCLCNAGYYLADNGVSCMDINECNADDRTLYNVTDYQCENDASITDPPMPLCSNTPGAYMCYCEAGYEFETEPNHCEDLNECEINNGGCEGNCTNLSVAVDGSMYNCSCNEGFQLNLNMHSCDDIDECTSIVAPHDCDQGSANPPGSDFPETQALCKNMYGTYECYCMDGWTYNSELNVCEAPGVGDCDTEPRCEHNCTMVNETAQCLCDDGFELLNDERSCQDVDECVLGSHNCSQLCHNELGYYTCACEEGYMLADDGFTCENVDECADQNGGCQHLCADYEGGYNCSCNEHYFLLPDEHSCTDVDECAADPAPACAHNCVNKLNGYECTCNPGYILNEDAHACDNVDECLTHNGGCEQNCEDSDGSYECSCEAGWQLSNNNHTCIDVDECASDDTNPCTHQCMNTLGSYKCACDPGYALNADKATCDDINECDDQNGRCQHTCTNGVGNYTCSCEDNYTLMKDEHTCDDVDECADDTMNDCTEICINTAPGYRCACEEGYELAADGISCEDTNECLVLNGGCEGTCTNTEGSYNCTCADGLTLSDNGHSCNDIDECVNDADNNCDQVCVNLSPGYRCECETGYEVGSTEGTCVDTNECLVLNGGCEGTCTNTEGSYNCTCADGLTLSENGHSCNDIDECVNDADNNCEQVCVNLSPGYRCECETGYEVGADDDGTCADINECEIRNGGCEEGCENTDGGFTCTCPDGFDLTDNLMTCVDINECELATCDQICVNTVGSYLCLCDGEYRLTSDQQQCVLGRLLRMNLCYDRPYEDVYAQISAEESRQLADDIEEHVAETMVARSDIARNGNFEYQVTRFYPSPFDKLCMDVVALPKDGVSDGEMALFASELSSALPVSPLVLNGVETALASDPEFVYADGDNVRKFKVDIPCDYYFHIDYCQNEGECIMTGGLPTCRCPSAYSGPKCQINRGPGLTQAEIGLIAGFSALFAILSCVACALCCGMCRNRGVAPVEEPVYYPDYQEEQPATSVILATRPAYAYHPEMYHPEMYGETYYGYK